MKVLVKEGKELEALPQYDGLTEFAVSLPVKSQMMERLF